jgi:hypothetical protein
MPSPGETIFIIGIGGMALTAAIGIAVFLALSRTRKRLNKKYNDEYGIDSRQ